MSDDGGIRSCLLLLRACGAAAAALLPGLLATSASAADRTAPVLANGTVSLEVYTGAFSATARELVYDVPGTGQKVSQLNWQVDRAALLGARLSYAATPWLTLRADGWTAFAASSAMDDFDWLFGYSGADSWSDWSHHREVGLPVDYRLDASAEAAVWRGSGTVLSVLAGLRYETMKWNARGGSYIYSTNGFRDDVGSFDPGEPIISYRQWWTTPYLGVAVAHEFGALTLRLEAIGSPFASVHDRDYHLVDVQTIFKERFSPTWMAGVRADVAYAITPMLRATLGVEYDVTREAKGGALTVDYPDSLVLRQPRPASGASLETMIVRVGLNKTF
jgi:plasminogen activator